MLGYLDTNSLNISISDGAGSSLFEQVLSPAELPIYYRDGASAWRIYETTDKANAVDAGYVDGSNDLKYNKLNGTWANATVGLNNYVAYYVVATNERTEPVALIMGQRVDNKLSDAKTNNVFSGLSLTNLPFEEMVVLARLILKDTGSSVYYTLEEVQDLRGTNVGGSITSPLITDHGGLGGLGDDDHNLYMLGTGSSTDHTLPRFDGTDGRTMQTSGIVVDDSDNVSGVGTLGCGTITISDGGSLNLQEDITFTGATTENQIVIPTNLADALSITDGVGDLMVFTTTTGSQTIQINPNVGIGAAYEHRKEASMILYC